MVTKISALEMQYFKTAILAEMRDGMLPGQQYPDMDDGTGTKATPVAGSSAGAKQSYTGKTNYIRHLNLFFLHLRADDRLKAHHTSLYLALFYIWNCNHFDDEFKINRRLLMQLSKIGSRSTYLDSLKWLQACGYIQYHPGGQMFENGSVRVMALDNETFSNLVKAKKNGPLQRPSYRPHTSKKSGPRNGCNNDTLSGPDSEPEAGPLLRHIINKQINNETESKQLHAPKKIISNEKRTPTIEDVMDWFSQKKITTQEAQRFFFHYKALNWTISGQPIGDWEAAAEKWITNIKTFKNDKPGKIHIDNDKEHYSWL